MSESRPDSTDDFSFINELGRKAVHLVVLAIPVAYHWLQFEILIIQLTLLGALIVFLPLEFYRLKINPSTWINYITRQSEKNEPANYILTTATWFFVMLGVNVFYSMELAEIAIVASHLGDSAAALIGSGIGRVRLPLTKKKTVEGYFSGLIGTYFFGFVFLLIFAVPSLLLPLIPTIMVGIFDFFEDLPFWAADNIFHPVLTVLLASILNIAGISI